MEFVRVFPPMRWQLCASCNDIIYMIVSPDECPKCGRPIVVRSPATSQTAMSAVARIQRPELLRPPATLHVATAALARPQVPKPPLWTVCLHVERLMFDQAIVAMIRRPVETDSSVLAPDKSKSAERMAARSHSWTEEEWASWRRERGFRAWAGRADGSSSS